MEETWSFTLDPKRSQKRARFNLLALEHGEYYFQDYSAYFYPSSSSAGTMAPGKNDLAGLSTRPRQQGRLKLCSRGLLFEPADRLLPLLKYPFRHMETQMEPMGGGGGGGSSVFHGEAFGGREGFRFRCTVVVESRRNDEVGPYVTKRARDSGTIVEWSDWTFSFALLHTPVGDFLREARRLREVALRVKERGHGYEEPLLRPLLEERLMDSTRKFDTIHLVDFRETLLLPRPVRVDRITPLLRNPGCLMVTDARVYFQPAELNNVGEPVTSFSLAGVVRVFKRRHMLRQTGLELFLVDEGGSAFLNFESSRERDELFDVLMSQPSIGPRAHSARDIEAETKRWQSGQVSNYDYLVFLNTVAGRTVNDLTQYPVFPWVLQDFHSATLNLDDERVYRDLSRPIGALNAERLDYFRTRFLNMPDPSLHPGQGIPPPFLYGTHYSTPGYALFFLVRSAPEEMLCLQNGRFDDPDRSFTSMKGAWESVMHNHADLKELIPEFYAGDGSFLTNRDDLQLGITQGGQRVGDVDLPPWARNPRDFVRKMRRALESPYVSRRLHLWIDLIFGCRQRGKAAVEADNLFYHLTYEGTVDLETVDDPRERAALESQISEFGQCPSLLFSAPHPRRDDHITPVLLAPPFEQRRRSSGGGGGGGGGGSDGDRLGRSRSPYEANARRRSAEVSEEEAALMSSLPPPPSSAASDYLGEEGFERGGRLSPILQQQQQRERRVSSPGSAGVSGRTSPSLNVGGSVGALWKRGLAMAGVAAEAGGLKSLQLQRWPGANGVDDRHPRHQGRVSDPYGRGPGAAAGSLGSPTMLAGAAAGASPIYAQDQVHRTQSAPDGRARAKASQREVRSSFHEGNEQVQRPGGFNHRGDGSATASDRFAPEAGRRPEARFRTASPSEQAGVQHRLSSPPMPATGTQGLPLLLPALAAARGTHRRRLDAWKVELRPGEPMGLHRDGLTGVHLVRACSDDASSARNEHVHQLDHQPRDPRGVEQGLILCTSAKDCSLKICSLEREAGGSGPISKAHTRRRVAGGELALSCCALTADGKHAVAGSWDNGLLLYSVDAACVATRVDRAHEDGISCLALHEQSPGHQENLRGSAMKMLATGSWDAAVKVWRVQQSEMDPLPVFELFDLETPVQALAIDGTGKALAAAGEDGMVAVWDTATGALASTFRACAQQCPVVVIRWVDLLGGSPPGSAKACLLLASADGDVFRFSVTGALLGLHRLDSEVVAMDSDGCFTVVGCRDGSLRLLGSTDDGGFVQTAVRESGLDSDITCLQICEASNSSGPGGSVATIVTGSEGGAVRVWDVIHRSRV